ERGGYHSFKRAENGCLARVFGLVCPKELAMFRRILFAGLVAWGVGATSSARAQDEQETKPRIPAARSAEAGEFLPFTLASRVDSQRAFVTTLGGYDSARQSALLQGTTEITIWGPIAIRAGVVYTETTNTLQPTFGGHVQLLKQ